MATRRGSVLDNLQTVLDQMIGGAGYLTAWKVGYASLPEHPPVATPGFCLVEGREDVESRAYPVLDWRMAVEVHGFAKVAHAAGVKTRETADGMIVDIVKAVMADPSRGGHAMDTMVVSAERLGEVSPDVYVIVALEILYRTSMTDPASGV